MRCFKVLGILTGRKLTKEELKNDINSDYLKVLNENTYYPFSKSFSYSKSNQFIFHSDLSPNIFSLEKGINEAKNDLSIEVSAIVGRNGTGKSTLFDFFYLASYNLGCHFKHLEYFEQHGEPIKYGDNEEFKIGDTVKYPKRLLFFSILYQIEHTYFLLELDGYNVSLKQAKECEQNQSLNFGGDIFSQQNSKEDYEKYFYSVANNYSIYGLNSNHIGKWINSLFHKNDGYKIPLVINPMRTEGNFDINEELSFSNDRVLSNVISEQFERPDDHKIMLTEKHYVKEIKFTLKDIYRKQNGIIVDVGTIQTSSPIFDFILVVQEVFFGVHGTAALLSAGSQIPFIEEIYNYLKHKYDRITSTYEEYSRIRNSKLNEDKKLRTVLEKINSDNSHVTFKFKQCINFLNINLDPEKAKVWEDHRESKTNCYQKLLDVSKFIEWSEIDKTKNISEFLPPSIFKKEVVLGILGEEEDAEEKNTIGDLSSGEQQLINSVQTVTYHLNNIQSVHNSNDPKKVKYKCVNIMFDEIELYFHPDYQRRFLKDLIRAIQRLEIGDDRGIEFINIIFATHSPFILSDIPSSNILRLTLDENNRSIPLKNESETFGANIHKLLANDFFLNKGYIGAFAKSQIDKVLDFINNKTDSNSLKEFEKVRSIVDLLGEPVIKHKLTQMLEDRFPSYFTKGETIEEKIKQQENILRNLQSLKNKEDNENN